MSTSAPTSSAQAATVLPATSAELVEFLRVHGASTAKEIHAALSPGRPHVRPRDTAKRMNQLRALGWIDYEYSRRGYMLWYACVKYEELGQPKRRYAALRAPNTAPPPQHDVMRAPLYTGAHAQVVRPGALDHLSCASRGNRC